jgi:hypothetical protein
VHHGKYNNDVSKKFDMGKAWPLSMPMSMTTTLEEEDGKAMDEKEYYSMIVTLLYMTTMRLEVHFE